MLYKEDWDQARQRLEAWWHGEVIGRVALAVTARRDRPLASPAPVPAPDQLVQRWLDAEYRLAVFERTAATTYYGGEAFCYFDPHLGPGSLALYLGCEPVFSESTVWYRPGSVQPPRPELLRYDPDNRWWKAQVDLVRAGVERGRGRFLTAMPDLIENLDTIASLRGTEQLLCDLHDRPAWVHACQRRVLELYFEHFDRLYEMVADPAGGNCFSAFQIWAPGRMAKLQCDFSAMIGPAAFEQFVLPYLAEQCRRLDFTVYHLDGPAAVRHLDLLLQIPELDAIQWTPGAGQPSTGSPMWFDLYRRVRAAGKGLLLLGVAASDVPALVGEFGPAGLLIATSLESETEARDLLRRAETWT